MIIPPKVYLPQEALLFHSFSFKAYVPELSQSGIA